LTSVDVAAGNSVTVFVTVIGVPFILAVVLEELNVEFPGPEVMELVVEFRMEAVDVCMQPFGEQMSAAGQHPPPVLAEHSTSEAIHCGLFRSAAAQSNSDAEELQQKIPDGVEAVG